MCIKVNSLKLPKTATILELENNYYDITKWCHLLLKPSIRNFLRIHTQTPKHSGTLFLDIRSESIMVSVAQVLENEKDLVTIGMLCFTLFNLLHISHTDSVSLDDDCFSSISEFSPSKQSFSAGK